MTITKMSWRPQYRSSKFRHVFGKPANKENCYDGVPITKSVQDNQFCAVNPRFVAVVTECAGGGAFLVLTINHTGKVDPHHPRVSGHRGNVLDIKWNPFDDLCIASCSEDCTVKIWDIPKNGVLRNITIPQKELQGHSRRVGLIEWHPTANNILFSSAYDYKVMVWNLDCPEPVIKNPVKTISFHTDVVLSMSFNTNGSQMATSCKDKKIRVIDPRSGTLLQEGKSKSQKVHKVMFLGNLKMLFSSGASMWNNRHIALWDQEDLSQPLVEEDLDGSTGVVFPFYDPDTHMLYLAGKGEGYIRYYEMNSEKPYMQYLNEYRSHLPQKGLGVMPKRALDVNSCEVFKFYKLVSAKSVIEPLSMIVPRRTEGYQEDIYPMTAGNRPALSAAEWLSGQDKDPVLISLKPGSKPEELYPELTSGKLSKNSLDSNYTQTRSESNTLNNNIPDKTQNALSNGREPCSTPKNDNELLQAFYRQQEEICSLKEALAQRDVRITQLELEIRNLRNTSTQNPPRTPSPNPHPASTPPPPEQLPLNSTPPPTEQFPLNSISP
ncbi:hypothetical protein COCON_G00105230 [Conger conger]|uniref:Coronin n=1 Tax=Conger conger TaxID=82655 RepID=A0A9Q1HZE4_CONCO|nr:hypothetical protein COCON_G00105230 [Conger conger]